MHDAITSLYFLVNLSILRCVCSLGLCSSLTLRSHSQLGELEICSFSGLGVNPCPTTVSLQLIDVWMEAAGSLYSRRTCLEISYKLRLGSRPTSWIWAPSSSHLRPNSTKKTEMQQREPKIFAFGLKFDVHTPQHKQHKRTTKNSTPIKSCNSRH